MKITYKGQTRTLKEWSKHLDIPYSTLYIRLRKQMPLDQVFSKEHFVPDQAEIFVTYNGKRQSIAQWAEELKISYNTLRSRIKLGFSDNEVIEGRISQAKLQRAAPALYEAAKKARKTLEQEQATDKAIKVLDRAIKQVHEGEDDEAA